MRIKSISLDLCIGNKASLVWVGQDHFFHRLKFLELIVDQTPIPACFNDGFAWPFQTGKKLRKPSCAIAFDSSLAQLPPALIQRAQHAVLLVDIYSDVVHENSFLPFFFQPTHWNAAFMLPVPDPSPRKRFPWRKIGTVFRENPCLA